MGFRGEALASIAAVAQVELRTRTAENELGFYVEVENSQLIKTEPIAAPVGTSVAMKNLFFNVPARRNFLKSHAAEMRHIIDEFTRVALAFPSVAFSLHANHQQLFQLDSGTLKQRIVQLMGASYESRLVTVKEETDYLTIRGFVGKPDTARKTRGEQYFFVNNRFIKGCWHLIIFHSMFFLSIWTRSRSISMYTPRSKKLNLRTRRSFMHLFKQR
jgi:DNA mismatch repair protein MutL